MHQTTKLKKLKINQNTQDINKLIVNLSGRILSFHEISLLKKGFNFNISRPRLTPFNVIPTIETALNVLPSETPNEMRNKIMTTLLHQKSHNPNITKNELYALKQLG